MAKAENKIASSLPWLLLVGGLTGLYSAIKLTLEKIELLKNPDALLGCDINPIVACGPVINTDQASAFGPPNPLLGIAGFAAVAVIGGAILAKAKFERWFWLGLQFGLLFAVLFIHWLIFQTIFRLGALCPYCMVVWSVTIPIFWYTTLYNLQAGHLRTPKPLKAVVAFAQKHHFDILVVWFLAIIGVILQHFWYYWETLI